MALCAPRLFRAACAMLRFDEETASDMTQESLLEACRALDRFDGRSDLYTWLYAILRRNVFRQSRSRRTAPSGADPARNDVRDDKALRPGDAMEQEEKIARLRVGIAGLPDALREVVVLRYLEGVSGEEMAATLRISHARVRSRLTEARQALLMTLQEEERP
ncbi:MAG: sigma-70 family RNA polymerase sigma factor [Planctomycetes bacterium]|nr:sigma-70 family RNA polymerase sigma factor [Planctomycetota bacterium]